MNLTNTLTIAVDFDGTIVEDAYPKIGKERIFAFETLKRLQADGHRLILWTYRSGRYCDEAVEFCRENGIEFYAVNESFPNEKLKPRTSRKINADLFIDDRNIGGILSWGEVYQLITNEEPDMSKVKKKKGFLGLFK